MAAGGGGWRGHPVASRWCRGDDRGGGVWGDLGARERVVMDLPPAVERARLGQGGSLMSAMGHFLWFILGGVFIGLMWWFVGLVAYVSVVGMPWGKVCFGIGQFSCFPFGKEAISRKELTLQGDSGTEPQGWSATWYGFSGQDSGEPSGT